MFDYDFLETCCVYKNGTLTWITDEHAPVVYILRIGEENYVGSTWDIRNRINNYITTLPKGNYNAKSVQDAYNKVNSFVCYILERIIIGDIRVREQFYINLIKPSLNTFKTASTTKADFMENRVQDGYFHLRTSACLKEYNLSPKYVAEKLGMSTYSFNKKMQFPSHDFLYKVARTMNIPFIAFFTNEPYHPQGTSSTIKIDGKTYALNIKPG